MFSPGTTDSPFTLLSTGDLLDRAVRLYRREWRALLLVVLWPALINYAGVISFTVGVRNFSATRGDWRLILNVLLVAGGVILYVCGRALFFFALGAAARAVYGRLVDGEPLRARAVYREVRQRFWPLVGAALCIGALGMMCAFFLYLIAGLSIMLYVLLATLALTALPFWAQVTIHVLSGVAALVAFLWLFLLIYERAVYVPQIMLVEGRGVFSALGRSFTLAGRGVWRVAMLLLFEFFLYWALFSPVIFYGSLSGVGVGGFFGGQPLWYDILSETAGQVCQIVTAPVWLVGCVLLYSDRRVRREGLDLELLANRHLPFAAGAPPLPGRAPTPAPAASGQGFEDAGLTVISLR
jgi:hypothetical protein